MHVLAVNSVSTLLNYLTEQLQNTPTLAQIQNIGDEEEMEEGDSDDEDAADKKAKLKQKEEEKVIYLLHAPRWRFGYLHIEPISVQQQ